MNLKLNKKTPKSFAHFLAQANKNKNGIYNTILTLDGRTFAFAIKLVSSNQSKVFSFLGFEENSCSSRRLLQCLFPRNNQISKEVDKRELALKKTLDAIKIKDNKTRTILDNALDGILLVSRDWKILEWNKQTKILKIVKEKRGNTLFDFIANTKEQNKEDIIRICERVQKRWQ